MAFTGIGRTVLVANGVDTNIHTNSTTDAISIIGSIIAYNTGGGASTLRLSLVRPDGTRIIVTQAIGATTAVNYNRGGSNALTPLTLLSGDSLVGQDTAATVQVTISGLQITVP